MFLIQVTLLICIGILFYSYIGYWIVVTLLVRIRGPYKIPQHQDDEDLPEIALIIAAYNESLILEEKIENCLQLNYPSEKKKIIFVTDGSLDNSMEIFKRYPGIVHLHEQKRSGKITAVDRAIKTVTSPIVVISDANALLNPEALREITRHYQDPRTGGVAGEKKVLSALYTDVAGTEGLYWKYESELKRKDAQLYSVIGAAGELFSFKTDLYESPNPKVILDDFVISLKICQKGYRLAYAPEAFASEHPSSSLREETKRKIRISAGGFQSLFILRDLLNIFKYPVLSFQYISHRVLRWALCPFLIPIAFLLNIYIAINADSIFFQLLMAGQIVFYLSALVGWYLSTKKIKVRFFYAAFYFVFINICLYRGLARYLRREHTVLWDKADRSHIVTRPKSTY
jgi:cellulose synthase/poly-beta-1,6-N-acetylglucosamine synthase-like glycosyltransferase